MTRLTFGFMALVLTGMVFACGDSDESPRDGTSDESSETATCSDACGQIISLGCEGITEADRAACESGCEVNFTPAARSCVSAMSSCSESEACLEEDTDDTPDDDDDDDDETTCDNGGEVGDFWCDFEGGNSDRLLGCYRHSSGALISHSEICGGETPSCNPDGTQGVTYAACCPTLQTDPDDESCSNPSR